MFDNINSNTSIKEDWVRPSMKLKTCKNFIRFLLAIEKYVLGNAENINCLKVSILIGH